MNRGYDQGLGLLCEYNMMFFVCTGFFTFSVHYGIFHIRSMKKTRCLGSGTEEVPSRFELENKGFADLRLTTWLWHRKKMER